MQWLARKRARRAHQSTPHWDAPLTNTGRPPSVPIIWNKSTDSPVLFTSPARRPHGETLAQ